MNDLFRRFAERIAVLAGSPFAFLLALLVVLAWLLTGPAFDFSDTWQLVINTGTTIVTFLMVFLIQNAQNRDARAMQIKLDELIRSTVEARDSMIDIEHLSDEQLRELQESFRRIAARDASARESLEELQEEMEEREDERKGDLKMPREGG